MTFTSIMPMLTLALPLLIGVITRYAMAGLKRVASTVDTWPAWAQQTIVVLLAALFTWAGAHGIDLCGGVQCTGLESITSGGIGTAIAAIFAMVTHTGKKVSELTTGTTAQFITGGTASRTVGKSGSPSNPLPPATRNPNTPPSLR